VFFLFLILISMGAQSKTLRDGLSLINQEKYKEANDIFKILSDKGDATASYWLAYTQFKTSGTLGVGSSLLKAAEGGNPWAMATLAGTHMPKVTTSYCNYLGWPCDEKWVDKAIEGWEKLAEEGDGKAMYALLYHDPSWWQYIPFYRDYRYGKLADKLYENRGYTFFFDDKFWSRSNEDVRIEFLKKIAKDGVFFGAYKVASIYKKRGDVEEAIKWINYGVKNNDYYAFVFKSLTFIPFMREKSVGSIEDRSSKRAYFYCKVANVMNSHHDCTLVKYFEKVYDDTDGLKYFDRYTGEKVTKDDIDKIAKKAIQRAEGHKAYLYLDETTIEFFRGYSKNI
jgi:hypothetical protein